MSTNLVKDLRSWKTTLVGLIGALVVWLPQVLNLIQGGTVSWPSVILGLTILSGGVVAKDGDKSTIDVDK